MDEAEKRTETKKDDKKADAKTKSKPVVLSKEEIEKSFGNRKDEKND